MMAGVVNAVVTALGAAGLSAGCAWPKTPVTPGSGFVRVGVERVEEISGGLARYLGVENDAQTGEHEVYGLRCTLTLQLDVYAPLSETNAAMRCLELFDTAAGAVSGIAGLHVSELRCGAPAPDRETGMFRLNGAAVCSALLLSASGDGDSGTFTDFVLRGELQV
jgi:hypothetical protein